MWQKLFPRRHQVLTGDEVPDAPCHPFVTASILLSGPEGLEAAKW
jgi:hypothetical protein